MVTAYLISLIAVICNFHLRDYWIIDFGGQFNCAIQSVLIQNYFLGGATQCFTACHQMNDGGLTFWRHGGSHFPYASLFRRQMNFSGDKWRQMGTFQRNGAKWKYTISPKSPKYFDLHRAVSRTGNGTFCRGVCPCCEVYWYDAVPILSTVGSNSETMRASSAHANGRQSLRFLYLLLRTL